MENYDTEKTWECEFLIVNNINAYVSAENTLFKCIKLSLAIGGHMELGITRCRGLPERDWWLLGHFMIKVFPLDLQIMFNLFINRQELFSATELCIIRSNNYKCVCFFPFCDPGWTDDSSVKKIRLGLKLCSNPSHKNIANVCTEVF